MRNWLICSTLLALSAFLPFADAGKKTTGDDETKEGLQALQDYIGNWKGNAFDKNKAAWTEKSSWSWRFKGKDTWMSFDLESSKVYKAARFAFCRTSRNTNSLSSTRPARKRSS